MTGVSAVAGPPPVLRVVGTDALLVEVADVHEAQWLYAYARSLVAAGELPAPRDLVPAARTLLVDGIGDLTALAGWRRLLAVADLTDSMPAAPAPGVAEQVIAVRYDGVDLGVVASAWSCDVAEVVRRHQQAVFTVAFCGFAPGFAYCTPDAAWPMVPRRSEPRTRVPGGSVALAGAWCGIYPHPMPGGWQLVGRTDVVVFDPDREVPALLAPGDRVRFRELR